MKLTNKHDVMLGFGFEPAGNRSNSPFVVHKASVVFDPANKLVKAWEYGQEWQVLKLFSQEKRTVI